MVQMNTVWLVFSEFSARKSAADLLSRRKFWIGADTVRLCARRIKRAVELIILCSAIRTSFDQQCCGLDMVMGDAVGRTIKQTARIVSRALIIHTPVWLHLATLVTYGFQEAGDHTPFIRRDENYGVFAHRNP